MSTRVKVGHPPLPPERGNMQGTEKEKAVYWAWHKEFQKARNTCAECLDDTTVARENYSMMWGEADLICTNCGGFIRDLDYG